MKYILTVEETVIHELEVELNNEITDLTSEQKSNLFDLVLQNGDVVYDNCDYDYVVLEWIFIKPVTLITKIKM